MVYEIGHSLFCGYDYFCQWDYSNPRLVRLLSTMVNFSDLYLQDAEGKLIRFSDWKPQKEEEADPSDTISRKELFNQIRLYGSRSSLGVLTADTELRIGEIASMIKDCPSVRVQEEETPAPKSLSAEEILKWIEWNCGNREVMREVFDLEPCNIGSLLEEYTPEGIVERIIAYEEKKKEEAEKQAEFEWVSICEIINTESEGIADNWHCEYREVISSDPSVQKKQAEELLKKILNYDPGYSRKYIARISEICRVKEN